MMFDAEGENEMKLLIDYAGLDEIRRLYEYYPLDGVTTNPAILAAQGEEPYETLKKIRAFIGPEADLHVQVVSPDAEGMLREARSILDCLGQNTCIKVPVLPEGLKAIKRLALDGVRVTATVVFTPMQAVLAAHAGAAFVAPYVNSIENAGFDGVAVAETIHETFETQAIKTQVLAASFKNTYQVQQLITFGIPIVTVVPEVLEGLLKSDLSAARAARFVKDFEGLCGQGATMER